MRARLSSSSRPPIHVQLCVVLALILVTPLHAGEAWRFDGISKVIALSDIHGDYGAMVRTLTAADVIDADGAWTAGEAHLVIVGDILDRGAGSRDAMDHLMRLEAEAQDAGGQVHVLIGNHEAMNLMGDLRYVIKGEYAAFAEDETAAERDGWFERYAERAGIDDSGLGVALEELRTRFDERFPPGFFAHRRAFAFSGIYGKWLLNKPVMVVINDTAFVHGGLSPMVDTHGLDGINGALRNDLVGYVQLVEELVESGALLPTDTQFEVESVLGRQTVELEDDAPLKEDAARLEALGDSPLHAFDGPLWYRGNVYCSRLVEEDRLIASLEATGARRLVIGHTPTPTRSVLERFDGRLVEVDTGMNAGYYKGKGHALIIEGDALTVIAEDGKTFAPEPHPRRVGVRPDGVRDGQHLRDLLETAPVLGKKADESGRTIVTVGDDTATVTAFFDRRQGREFYPDVAAYRLDRLLELDMVPVAVERRIDNKDGSLLYLAPKAIDEVTRVEAGRGGSAPCALGDQWPAMYLFDALIYNEGRSPNRMLYSSDIWQLMLVGHDRAFATRKGRPAWLDNTELKLTAAWRRALEALDAAVLEEELGGVLDKRRRKALLARRDELLLLP